MIQAPASLSAAILYSAVALSPVMIAPAWPMRLPAGADAPTTNAATGLLKFDLMKAAAGLPQGAVILPGFDGETPRDVWKILSDGEPPAISEDEIEDNAEAAADEEGKDDVATPDD